MTGVIGAEGTPSDLTKANASPSPSEKEDAKELVPKIKTALRENRATEALELANKAVGLDGSSHRMLAMRGMALTALKMPTAAIADCDAALEHNKESLYALRCRGKAHAMLALWEKSHKDLAAADKINPDDSEEGIALRKQVKANMQKMETIMEDPAVNEVLNDDQTLEALKNPEIKAAFEDCVDHPEKLAEYKSKPEIWRVMDRVLSRFNQ
ncbi:hypothetical protein PTSG_11164 [Salpingoeca rosetta]|uniref:STI1 domain-containing protein n=1 Tax=Salpingoeca rosetta (strain ATCC 50818 / BSB-021) TaxID=946362 RepID=F2USL8_SALR5|nr:uncharacterized protein PTSG_11164 [Salpingoeca rosetta]EGD81127.1 hypothetical protein PTSG_11164 [Salpingoeca rosetta]|eukprot:XP_004987812.1 hypothetical protein PTSG_11164 [Salpingoeca rosetta]